MQFKNLTITKVVPEEILKNLKDMPAVMEALFVQGARQVIEKLRDMDFPERMCITITVDDRFGWEKPPEEKESWE